MTISAIVPSHKAEKTLPRTLESLNAAAVRWCESTGGSPSDVEIIVANDPHGRGPSWARNCGLDRAKGDYVFFCDADDAVDREFFVKPMAALKRSSADICFFSYSGGPSLQSYELQGNEAIRKAYLPAFFGYSLDDVRRWNAGGDLFLNKEPGQVWRCAFRRTFLLDHGIRFDELLTVFEDAAFLSSCVAVAEKTVSIPDELYRYEPLPDGNMSTGWKSDRYWQGKFAALEFRKRLDAKADGSLWKFCEASCALTALEMLKEHRASLTAYLADVRVRAAIRAFPVSWRHPLVLAGILYLRWRMR